MPNIFKQQSIIVASIFLLCFILEVNSDVTYSNLVGFFKATYDPDGDGSATLQDFTNYFQMMEPEHQVEEEHIAPIFNFFDSDVNAKVTIKELVEVAKIRITYEPGHKQIHLGLTAKPGEMQVIWVSNPEHYDEPIVEFGRLPGRLNQVVKGSYHTYNCGGMGGFHGRIYLVVIKDLIPFKRYYYRVGDAKTRTFSKVKHFQAPPLRTQKPEELNFAVFGDMGTFAPFGHFVMDQISKDHFIKPYDLVFLTGDIAYAGVNKQGQAEPIWDLFGELTEKFAAYIPFMPGVGNHEHYSNYSAYSNRYVLPRQFPGQTNLFFSFDYGQAHFVHFSSEHPYQLGSAQYNFLEEDLFQARNNPNIEWIIVGVHRAFYSSDQTQFANVTNLARHLQGLMNKYKVDIVQVGHLHDYERTWPTLKGKAMMQGANLTHYVDPVAPVYVVQGTAGALVRQKFIQPKPEWSVVRQQKYGYGRMTIKGNELKYQFISIPGGRISDEWRIVKTKQKQPSPTIQTK